MFHYEFYNAKVSNTFYGEKILGAKAELLDKYLFGYGLTTIVVILLAGPLLFFSDAGGFIAPNPVHAASLSVFLVIKKRLNLDT